MEKPVWFPNALNEVPFEEHVKPGTPNWARYGSIPARIAAHLAMAPVRTAVQAARAFHGDLPPAEAERAVVGAGTLIAGGPAVGMGERGALNMGFGKGGAKPFKHTGDITAHPIMDLFTNPSERIDVFDILHSLEKGKYKTAHDVVKSWKVDNPENLNKIANIMHDWAKANGGYGFGHTNQLPAIPADEAWLKELDAELENWKPEASVEKPKAAQVAPAPTKKHITLTDYVMEGGETPDYFSPIHNAAMAYEYSGKNIDHAADILFDLEKKGYFEGNGFIEALEALNKPEKLPKAYPLSAEEVKLINESPEALAPYKLIHDAKVAGVPYHEHPDFAEFTKKITEYNKPLNEWSPKIETTKLKLSPGSNSWPFSSAVHPWDAKSPAVIRKSYAQAITPYDWLGSSNADPMLRTWNAARNPQLMEMENIRRAAEQGYNVNHPLVRGLDSQPVKFEAPQWEFATANPERIGPANPWTDAFTDPLDKGYERAIFAADSPIVSNAYAPSYGGSAGGKNFLMYGRSENPFQVYWPEANSGSKDYNSTTMHRLIEETRGRGGDMLAIHGIGDIVHDDSAILGHYGIPTAGSTHTQYTFMRPEQFRSVGADFNPLYASYPNLLLSHPSPWAFSGQNEER